MKPTNTHQLHIYLQNNGCGNKLEEKNNSKLTYIYIYIYCDQHRTNFKCITQNYMKIVYYRRPLIFYNKLKIIL